MGALKKRRRGCCTASSCSWVKTTMGGCLKAVDRPKNVGKTENISQQYRTNSYIPIDCQWYSIQKTHFSFIIIDWTMWRYYGTITINTTSNSLLWIYLDLFGSIWCLHFPPTFPYFLGVHYSTSDLGISRPPSSKNFSSPSPPASSWSTCRSCDSRTIEGTQDNGICIYIRIYIYIFIAWYICITNPREDRVLKMYWYYPTIINRLSGWVLEANQQGGHHNLKPMTLGIRHFSNYSPKKRTG